MQSNTNALNHNHKNNIRNENIIELDFIIHELQKENKHYKEAVLRCNLPNKFVLVGEYNAAGIEHYRVQQLNNDDSLALLGSLNIKDSAYIIPKDFLSPTNDIITYYINKQFLTLDILADILYLNK